MPDFKNKNVKTDILIPYANNSRTHSPEQVQQIANSIKEFGFTNPIIIDEGNGIIAGHGRVLAAEQLKIDKVPCVLVSGWSDAQKKAYVIADNQLALNAGWNSAILEMELDQLIEMEFNVDLLGFDDEFWASLKDDVDELTPPDDFGSKDDDEMAHKCPRCEYEFD